MKPAERRLFERLLDCTMTAQKEVVALRTLIFALLLEREAPFDSLFDKMSALSLVFCELDVKDRPTAEIEKLMQLIGTLKDDYVTFTELLNDSK